jgi:adenosine kinase
MFAPTQSREPGHCPGRVKEGSVSVLSTPVSELMLSALPGRLLVAGSLAFDYILGCPGQIQQSLAPLHNGGRWSVTLQASHLFCRPGGCGGNIAYTLALLGEEPRLLSVAGRDFEPYRLELERVGVDLSGVVVKPDELTASCVLLTDSAQNRVVAFYGGATDSASELDLEASVGPRTTVCLIAPDDSRAMLKFAAECRRLALPFIFDIGSQVTALSPDEIFAAVVDARVVLCNDYELSIFESKTGWTLQRLLEEVPVVVVTLGKEGSVIHRRGLSPIEVPATRLAAPVVDSTGAGDGYRAGFSYGWVRGLDLEICGRLGSVAAAFVVEAPGTQGHRFERELFFQRYREAF